MLCSCQNQWTPCSKQARYDKTGRFDNFERFKHLILGLDNYLLCLCAWCLTFELVIIFHFTSNNAAILCSKHLQNWKKMEYLPTPFLQTAQEKLALYSHLFSIFTTYHLFCQLAFTRISFDCNAPFQASSFPFRS